MFWVKTLQWHNYQTDDDGDGDFAARHTDNHNQDMRNRNGDDDGVNFAGRHTDTHNQDIYAESEW